MSSGHAKQRKITHLSLRSFPLNEITLVPSVTGDRELAGSLEVITCTRKGIVCGTVKIANEASSPEGSARAPAAPEGVRLAERGSG